jgi:ribosomal protein S18 acetylase RimI-like enzyme
VSEGVERSRSDNHVALRPTTVADLDFVVDLERDAENARFIGQWSRDEHHASLGKPDREHWIVVSNDGERLGYIILYDVRALGQAVYVKRIVVSRKSSGIGRRALGELLQHAFAELNADFVSLAVFPENERAQRAYRAAGFFVAPLTTAERETMRICVDPFPEACVVMIARPR